MHPIFLLNSSSSLITSLKSISLFRSLSCISRTYPFVPKRLSNYPTRNLHIPFTGKTEKSLMEKSAKLPLDEVVGIARKCWIKFQRDVKFALYSPFVVCLAAGDLKVETFKDCIAQNVHFLKAFAQAYELAEECADDDDAKHGINKLRNRVLGELKMRKELQALLDPSLSNHPYKKWIENYSSESFQASALQIEDLLDKLSVSLTGEELGTIEMLYHQAMKLEIEFFLAQPLAQQTVVPLSEGHNPAEDQMIIFSDFDLTCTIVDSSAVLAEIAILTAPKSDQNQPENQIARMSSADLRNTWSVLSKQYTEEYEQCTESILSTDKADNFNYEGLHKSLQQLSDFERRANIRVIESGVLKGLNLEDIKRAGERLILQDGCPNFFRSIMKSEKLNVNVHVLSYCWCDDLIHAAFSSGGIDYVGVHANEFTYQDSFSTGEIVKKVESPIDKVQAFSSIVQNCRSDVNTVTLYIGDSVGDLLCLLEADVGIVVGSSTSLRKIGTHYGVSFVPLYPGLVEKQKECAKAGSRRWKGRSGVLYTVSSWAEIHAFVLGQ
ncbi:hypothetical protein Leryth_027216 [Lithospermum erythrorhizon]|nr:hypothetical protein Leryth_027216 [Lithospermum erythrorhizon]